MTADFSGLALAETFRRREKAEDDRQRRAVIGQFLTPATTATFAASLFPDPTGSVRLLDPGAGAGALLGAFLDIHAASAADAAVTAVEVDEAVTAPLRALLAFYEERGAAVSLMAEDFVEWAVPQVVAGRRSFTHAILNPPYKKIGTRSCARQELSRAGIETVNIYAGFTALALELLEDGGELVAIIPRSFCNGPYYRPFRQFLLDRAALRHIHLFDTRNKAFRHDKVLQEIMIVRLTRGAAQGDVTVTTSADDTFADLDTKTHPFARIVRPGDRELFIHVPTTANDGPLAELKGVHCSLADLGLTVSTGPVVDFRLKDHLRPTPDDGTAPLLYPGHFRSGSLTWPLSDFRKANAIAINEDTQRWLYPIGAYTVVRRFSAKEERRRVVASVLDPDALPDGHGWVGIENHLNVFHRERGGLEPDLAQGLAVYLNSTAVDEHLRRFSGHTQVNATCLRNLPYPSLTTLMALGAWRKDGGVTGQGEVDAKVTELAA